jgi:hypothetical protein
MGTLSRSSLVLVVLLGIGFVVASVRRSHDWHVWPPSDVAPESDPDSDEAYNLRLRFLCWSSELRHSIAGAVVSGDLTLWEAAACFRQVDTILPEDIAPGRGPYRDGSEEERHCRHVIRFVRYSLQARMLDEGLAVHLEAELGERVRRGDLRLPDPPAGVVKPPDFAKR